MHSIFDRVHLFVSFTDEHDIRPVCKQKKPVQLRKHVVKELMATYQLCTYRLVKKHISSKHIQNT